MNYIEIIVTFLFLFAIAKQLKYIKALIIPIRKRNKEVIFIIIYVITFILITYIYAYKVMHYIIVTLGILVLISTWVKQGINSKGFVSMYRYKEVILWNEIEKVQITYANDVKISLSGNFTSQTFYFNKRDYEKIIEILKNNLPQKVKLQTNFNN